MFAKINFHDEFYQKLKLLVLPITMQQFMLALVSATDAIMLGAVSQTSLSAVSLAGQIQFVLNLFISGISAGSGIMAAQYWGKKDAASIEVDQCYKLISCQAVRCEMAILHRQRPKCHFAQHLVPDIIYPTI